MTDTPPRPVSDDTGGPAVDSTPTTTEGYAAEPAQRHTESSGAQGDSLPTCPTCGTPHDAGAAFCEACGNDLPGADSDRSGDGDGTLVAAATPQTAPAGDESPMDIGWTGVVASDAAAPATPDLTCTVCGEGTIVDGYCDHCGTPPPDPRNHFTEAPSAWVGGVCDIGRKHSRNEDAMALTATEPAGSRATLVVCDGVSMATDSHIASLAAATAARAVLDQPLPRGVGTPDALAAAAGRALTHAVLEANEAVKASVQTEVPNPPSCTFAAAIVEAGVIVAGNVGDSRVYWLPDAAEEEPRQLGQDDSYANEQMLRGVQRAEAEHGPNAHAITRWLGKDAPDDLTPHVTSVPVTSPGWLMVCSDGLWNYLSEAADLRDLLHASVARLAESEPAEAQVARGGPTPVAVAQALVDYANDQGGRDNITVALARLAGQGSTTSNGAAVAAAPEEGDPAHG